jgi:O-antigen/teichoic acid export membrane protein
MSVRFRAVKGSLWVGVGNLVVYAASFVRNMILARLLSKADFGIAATFGLVLTLMEFTAKLGISQFVVQDREGNEPGFIASAHLVQVCAAGISAVLILAGAPVLAQWFGIANHAWALMLLALVAVFGGLQHADVRRYQRELRFGPSAAVDAIPQVAITLAAWPVAVWLGDFRAMLVLLLAKSALSCALSHFVAEYPYRLAWHRERLARMLRFGWPLLVTGFLMFGVMQGDQFLVATFYDMSSLAPYAAAAALAYAPSFLFGGILGSVLFPLLSQVQDELPELRSRYVQAVALVTLVSAVTSVGMIVGGEALMRLTYGSKYAGSGVILAWLTAAVAFRNLRVAPSTAALARGDSKNQMISNGWRLMALAPMLVLAFKLQPIWMLACCGLVGEGFACWASIVRLRRRDGVPAGVTFRPALWLLALVIAAGGLAWVVAHAASVVAGLALAAACAFAAGVSTVALLPELRREGLAAWQGYRAQGWRGALAQLKGERPLANSFAAPV